MSQAIKDLFKHSIALNGKVIAEVLEKEEKQLESGIILTGESVNQQMEDFRRAKVISSDFSQVQPGDIVIYLRFAGSPAGEEIIVLDTTDILAKEI